MKTLLLASDFQLIEEFKNGNDKGLEVLIWRHKEKVFSSILFLVKDKYLAEDLFQDTFIKVIDSIRDNSYTEEGKFLAFAVRIAHNICVDHFRKVKRVQIINKGDIDFFEVFTSSDNSADQNIIQFQTSDRLKRLLNELPEDQREVIVLRHFADLSFKEIAEMTNCSINTALGRMRYALTNLRKMLAEREIAL
jgi:RNA polymerase sigma-70 factor (ECF subfamily)